MTTTVKLGAWSKVKFGIKDAWSGLPNGKCCCGV